MAANSRRNPGVVSAIIPGSRPSPNGLCLPIVVVPIVLQVIYECELKRNPTIFQGMGKVLVQDPEQPWAASHLERQAARFDRVRRLVEQGVQLVAPAAE